MILQRIIRCPHCGRENTASAQAIAEYPFCTECQSERVLAAENKLGPIECELGSDGYVRIIPCLQKSSAGASPQQID